jgi:hypothetical protein
MLPQPNKNDATTKGFQYVRYTDTRAFVALFSSSRQVPVYQRTRAFFHVFFGLCLHYHSITGRSTVKSIFITKLTVFRRVHKIAKRLLASSCLSVCPSVGPSAWNNSAPTGQIFIKFYMWYFPKLRQRKPGSLKFDKNNWCFIWRPMYIYCNTSLISSYNEKCFRRYL